MAIPQSPQHAQRIAAFELLEQLVDGGVFLGAHGRFSLRNDVVELGALGAFSAMSNGL
jgi:hypothetical protein